MIEPDTTTRTPRRVRMLARAIARRCKGRTLVLGAGHEALLERLEEVGLDATARGLDDSGSDERFDTVVLVRALEYAAAEDVSRVLRRAHALLAERGTLLVCVPHGDHVDDPAISARFDRRDLKRLLKTLDQPKVYTDQPYGWLLMGLSTGDRMDRTTEERHRVIARLCRGSVLELGCAAGHLCRRIADSGLDVRGIDKNADKIAKARRLFPALDFEQGDILELGVDRSFDTVVLAEVLEHVPADVGRAMLVKAWSLVAPGGRLIVSVPNEDCVPHKNHLCEFTARDLKGLLRPFGPPRTVVEQPFKWLLMHVQRPA